MGKKEVVVFRGTRTAQILADARLAGIVADGDKVVVVCRQGDRLAEPGDVENYKLDTPTGAEIVVVANGGTTAQVVPIVAALARHAAFEDAMCGQYMGGGTVEPRDWTWKALDVQPDGVRHLGGDGD